MGKHLVFVYGTLKRGQPNSHLFGSHAKGWFQFEGVGETVDLYRLVIASSMHIPFVLAEKGAGENVLGELYSVDDSQLAALDELEGHPHHYKRTEIPVRVIGESDKKGCVVQADCYLFYDFIPNLLQLPFFKSFDVEALPSDKKYVRPANRPNDSRPYDEIKVKKVPN